LNKIVVILISFELNPKGYPSCAHNVKNINQSVYTESTDDLEFELEVKKDVIKSFQQFLFNNQVEEFEKRLTQHFFNQSKKNFGLNFYYTDWIRDFYRKLSNTREFNAGLVTDYIKQTKCDSLDETVFLFRFLQFLSFIRKFEGKRECVDDQVYYIIEFPIVDFLHFLDKDVKSTYQWTKLMEFFKDLQELPPFVEKFSDSEFQSSIMFPLLKLTKQGRSWFLKIVIGEQLYWYSYPFRWTSSLCNFQKKYDLLVKLEIIQVLSTDSLKKKISVEDFLNQFSIPNKKRAEIKKLIIDLLDELKAFDLIEAGFDIVYVGKLCKASLKNPRMKKEYKAVTDQLKQGVHPVNLSERSTYVSPTKVLVKKPEGRYLVEVSDTSAEIVGVSSRTNDKCMARFKTLMNELYNLDLKGY
jgi:hypothetical protein